MKMVLGNRRGGGLEMVLRSRRGGALEMVLGVGEAEDWIRCWEDGVVGEWRWCWGVSEGED